MVHPRLRGKLSEYGFRSCTSVRFIPAYAGNSARFCAPVALDSVHPRLRGKLQRGGACHVGSIRFIPAYAGNSIKRYSFRRGYAVHPRLRGKLSFSARACCFSIGSSPLTRETHLKWLQHYTNRLTAKLLKNISKQE